MPERCFQREFSKVVHSVTETTKRTRMVNHLQQLRLRAPNMIKKEYRQLMHKVMEKDEGVSESQELLQSAIETREAFPNAFLNEKRNKPIAQSAA